MKGIDKITARILADAEQETRTLLPEAETEAQELAKQYDKQAQDAYWKLVTAGKQAADQRAERLTGAAVMEAKKQILAFKQELVEQVFHDAVSHLVNLPEEQQIDLLASLAVRAATTGEETLIFSAKDREKYGRCVVAAANEKLRAAGKPGHLTLSEETREMAGGLIVTDGLVDVNCSFEVMVEAQRSALTGPVAELLFD